MHILVTGGTGFIGSHATVELLETGHKVTIIDNLSNSKQSVVDRIKEITSKDVAFYKEDLLNKEGLTKVFEENTFDAVMHFAGYKAVGESVEKPLMYYHNNVYGTMVLLDVMKQYNVKKMVFSSSATVYGLNNLSPLTEDMPLDPINPYGQTKMMIEQILKDVYQSDSSWSIVLLRYFNPIGAHPSGLIGEEPSGIPNNLLPYITQVASEKLDKLKVFGNDYDTHDGTGVRDYIHVVDLAKGHVKALDYIADNNIVDVFNLGTGKGYSVLDVIKTFEKENSLTIPYEIVDRRSGDVGECFANPEKANKRLEWATRLSLKSMVKDAWNWESNREDIS